MSPAQWRQIDELFDSALRLEPVQRAAFLEEACARDEQLRHSAGRRARSDSPGYRCARANAVVARPRGAGDPLLRFAALTHHEQDSGSEPRPPQTEAHDKIKVNTE